MTHTQHQALPEWKRKALEDVKGMTTAQLLHEVNGYCIDHDGSVDDEEFAVSLIETWAASRPAPASGTGQEDKWQELADFAKQWNERMEMMGLIAKSPSLPTSEPVAGEFAKSYASEVLHSWGLKGYSNLMQELERAIQFAYEQGQAHPHTADGLREAWQPIESAPTDGTVVLYFSPRRGPWIGNEPDGCARGRWSLVKDNWGGAAEGWGDDTHWRPLPLPPGALSPTKRGA